MPTTSDAMAYALNAANAAGIDGATFLGLIQTESSWNPYAQPRNADGSLQSSAYGYGQLLKGTAASLGVDRTNWQQNLTGSANYLASLVQQFGGNYTNAVAAYHDGAGAVKANGISAAGSDYVSKVAGYASQYSASGIAGSVRGQAASFLSSAWDALGKAGYATGVALATPGDILDKGVNAATSAVSAPVNALIGRVAIILFAFIFIAAGLFMIAPKGAIAGTVAKVAP